MEKPEFQVTPDKTLHIDIEGFARWLRARYPGINALTVEENADGSLSVKWDGGNLKQISELRRSIQQAESYRS